MTRTRWPIALMTLVVAMLALAIVVSADNSWGNYHWARTSNPLTLSLGDNVSGKWDAHLAVANSDWNVSTVLTNSVDAGRTSSQEM